MSKPGGGGFGAQMSDAHFKRYESQYKPGAYKPSYRSGLPMQKPPKKAK